MEENLKKDSSIFTTISLGVPIFFLAVLIGEFVLLKYYKTAAILSYLNIYNLLLITITALIYYWLIIKNTPQKPVENNNKMYKFWKIIESSSMIYFLQQLLHNGLLILMLAICLSLVISLNSALVFLIGFLLSSLLGFWGITIASKMNIQVAKMAIRQDEYQAVNKCILGGITIGMVVLLPLLLITNYKIFSDFSLYFSFGAAMTALTTRMTGGIFTKSADIAADLVGKLEYDLPEDDFRNPAVLADNIGDIVGDCIGSIQSFFAVAVFLFGILSSKSSKTILQTSGFLFGIFTIVMIISSGIFFLLCRKRKLLTRIIAFILTNIFLLIGVILISKNFFSISSKHFILGLFAIVINTITVYFFTAPIKGSVGNFLFPINHLAKSSEMGAGFNVLLGLSLGKMCVVIVLLELFSIILISFWFTGFLWHGIDFAFGFISLSPILMAIDSFGPIADNAGGLVESMEEVTKSAEPRRITDNLDRFGNTSKAITKVLTYILLATVLIPCFLDRIIVFNLLAVISCFIGAIGIFLFTALSTNIVLNVSAKIVQLIRQIFNNNPKVLSGEEEPNYNSVIAQLTKKVLSVAHIPIYITLLFNIIFVSIFFSIFNQNLNVNIVNWTATPIELFEGFIPHAIPLLQIMIALLGLIMGMYMSVSGGAWDNCKKFIETGMYGGKKSSTHHNAIIGDLVGDIFKDTIGPALCPFIIVSYNLIDILCNFIQKFLF